MTRNLVFVVDKEHKLHFEVHITPVGPSCPPKKEEILCVQDTKSTR